MKGVLHGRNPGPVLGVWIGCGIAFALLVLLEIEMPAFHEVLKIFYFVIAVVFIIATARFFRQRGGDRRSGDRRVHDRRENQDAPD
jgi:hypothetical protein